MEYLTESYRSLWSMYRQWSCINNPYEIPPEDCDIPFRISQLPTEDGEFKTLQILILLTLDYLYQNKFRRYKDTCVRQVLTSDKRETKCWEVECEIKDVPWRLAKKESNAKFWMELTKHTTNAQSVTRYLTECQDNQFNEISKNRSLWSFNNGIFVGKVYDSDTGKYTCKFIPYDTSEFLSFKFPYGEPQQSAKYFDCDFDTYENASGWYEIPTPCLQSILDYQGFTEEVSKWVYCMLGRMCFNVGDMDNWQVLLFLQGVARSGKSTITKLIAQFYAPEDIRTLSNNIERQFGLQSIYDGFLFIAPEIKKDIKLEQAEFQSMVSGESVSVARKFEKAKSIDWITPGLMAGNETPEWKDNAGSIMRRLFTLKFENQVEEADCNLDAKLKAEIPALLYKCVKAYLQYSQLYGSRDIWNVVPNYFKDVQIDINKETNPLLHFLEEGGLTFDPKSECSFEDFSSDFRTHVGLYNLRRGMNLTRDAYSVLFAKRKISVVYRGGYDPETKRTVAKTRWVIGIDLPNKEKYTPNTIQPHGRITTMGRTNTADSA